MNRPSISEAERFSFTPRPVPVPGDLRINWRVSIVLLMLKSCRSNRASFAKLHLLNDAVRSEQSSRKIERILVGQEDMLSWRMRVEPAFGRAIDFAVGDKFAGWTRTAQKAGLQLTKDGIAAAQSIERADDVLLVEKAFIRSLAKQITEEFVTKILGGQRSR